MAARGIAKKWQQMTDAQYLEYYRSKCVVDENGCWIWKGFIQWNGYGQTSYRGKQCRVHRAMYICARGPIPEGHDVCHTCDVRACCNPDHLWTGTRKQNMEDCTKKQRHGNLLKTHCVNGHEFTPDNIIWRKKPSGIMGRHCKICCSSAFRTRRQKEKRQHVLQV